MGVSRYTSSESGATGRIALYRGAVVLRDLIALFRLNCRSLGPSDVNIEPSNLCNADCIFCGYQFQRRPHQEISIEHGRRIIQAAKDAGARRIGFTPVVGEPLVHRDLEHLIRFAGGEPHPLHVGLTTNGLLLTPKRYRSLVQAGINEISISMTYPDEAEYFRIYRNKGLAKLLENLKGVIDIYERGSCDVSLSIRTPRTDWRRHDIFDRAASVGWAISRNIFFDDWSGRTRKLMEPEGLMRRPGRAKILPCSMLYSGPHFFSDGRATACGCRDLDGASDLALEPETLMQDMRKVYAVGAVEALRQRFRSRALPEICATCRHYSPSFENEGLRLRLRQLFADFADALRLKGR